MQEPSILEQLKVLCLVGSPDDPHHSKLVEQLLESAKAMQAVRADQFLKEAGFCPLLISYSNDGTGLKSKRALGTRTLKGSKQRRVGKKYYEVLVQQCFLRYISAG